MRIWVYGDNDCNYIINLRTDLYRFKNSYMWVICNKCEVRVLTKNPVHYNLHKHYYLHHSCCDGIFHYDYNKYTTTIGA